MFYTGSKLEVLQNMTQWEVQGLAGEVNRRSSFIVNESETGIKWHVADALWENYGQHYFLFVDQMLTEEQTQILSQEVYDYMGDVPLIVVNEELFQ